ncbi:MAG: hypothetical protein H0W88_03250 [Parachlamydiaceae bacterium]|nr:hypothetical protein [Parachlamydiaceae bacterium]
MLSGSISLVKSYISGSCVDRTLDLIIERSTKNLSEVNRNTFNDFNKTQVKIAMLWLAASTVLITTIATPLMPLSIGYKVCAIALTPLANPLCKNVKVYACNWKSQTIDHTSSIFLASIFVIGQVGVMNLMKPSKFFIPYSLLLSNITLCSNIFLHLCVDQLMKQTKKDSDDFRQNIVNDTINFEARAKELERQLREIDGFINDRPDLHKICIEYMEKFPEYIVWAKPVETMPLNSNIIKARSHAQFKVANLNTQLRERKEFIERHKEVYDAFVEHIQKANQENGHPASVPLMLTSLKGNSEEEKT